MERKYYLRGLGVGIAVTAIIMGIALSGDQKMTDDEIIARAKELGMVENTVLAAPDGEEAGEENTDIQDETDSTDAAIMTGQDHTTADGAVADAGSEAAAADTAKEPADEAEPVDEAKEPADSAESVDEVKNPADNVEPEEQPQNGAASAQDNGDKAAAVNDHKKEQAERDGKADTPEKAKEIITSAAVKTITVNHGDGSYTVAKKLEDVGVVTSAVTFDTFLCQNGYDKRLRTGTFSIPADASDEQIARIVTGAE